MKKPIFIDREVSDMLGTSVSPGDILSYASKQSMRIAVYFGILENKKGKQSVALYLVSEEELQGHLITIPVYHTLSNTPDPTIIIDKGILINPEFHVNNNLIQNAIKIVDDFKDEGILK